MDDIKAILVDVNKDFEVVKEKTFDEAKMPINCFSNCNAVNGKHPAKYNHENSWYFHYYWIVSLMFP